MKLTTTIDVQLISKANAREHRRVRDQRVIKEREATYLALFDGEPRAARHVLFVDGKGARVTLSRPYHETPLDDDNIRAAFKAVRDEIARFLGSDDGSPSIHFIYQQTKAVRTGVKQSKPGWKKVKDKETGEVARVRKVVKNVAAYDTRPTVTIEVMPVQDIDPQVKRVRELEARVAELEGKISDAAFSCPKCGRHDYGLWSPPILENLALKKQLDRWVQFYVVGLEGPKDHDIVTSTQALLTSSK